MYTGGGFLRSVARDGVEGGNRWRSVCAHALHGPTHDMCSAKSPVFAQVCGGPAAAS